MAISFVKSANAVPAASPITATFGSNFSLLNWLIGTAITSPNVLGSLVGGGGTWVQDVSANSGSPVDYTTIQRLGPIATAGTTVVATSTGSNEAIAFGEFSGVGSLMAAQGTTGTSASPVTSTITNVPAGALVVVAVNIDGFYGVTLPSGFTSLYGTQWVNNGVDASYLITSSSGSVSATWTATGSGVYQAVIAVYLPTLTATSTPSLAITAANAQTVQLTAAIAPSLAVADVRAPTLQVESGFLGRQALGVGFLGGDAAPSTTGTIYYVSSAGSDSNNGLSPSTPWQTITHVNAHTFVPGDTILFNGGNTFSGAIYLPPTAGTSSVTPITFGSYGTGQATISSSTFGIYAYDVGGVIVENLTFTGSSALNAGDGGVFFYADNAQYSYIQVLNCTTTGYTFGVVIEGISGGGYNGITITNVTANGNRDAGIIVSGPTFTGSNWAHANVSITNCTAYSNLGNTSNTTGPTGFGILMESTNVGSITDCVAYSNGGNNGDAAAGPVGIMAFECNSVVISQSLSYNNTSGTAADGDGFDLDTACSNCTIEYCLAYGNQGAGYLLYSSNSYWSNNTVRYNMSWGNGTSTLGSYFGEITVINNTGGSVSGLTCYNNTAVSQLGSYEPLPVYIGGTMSGVVFYNNILYSSSEGYLVQTGASYTTGQVDFVGNDYFRPSGFLIDWNGTNYTSLAAWQAAQGQEKIGGTSYGYAVDPVLSVPNTSPTVTSPTNLVGALGMALQASSTMASTGLNLNSLFSINPGTQDYFGLTLPASSFPIGAALFFGALINPSLALAASGPSSAVALTAAISSSLAIATTNTEAVALTAALAPTLAITTANTEAVALTGALSPTLIVTDTNTESVALTAAIAPSLVVTAADTEAVALTAALAPDLIITASNDTEAVALTASIAPALVITDTNTENVALTASVAPVLTITANVGTLLQLTAAIAPSLAISTSNTEAVALTAALAPALVITDTNTEAVAITASIAPNLTITAANKEAVALTAAITPSLAIAASNAETVQLTASIAPSLTVATSNTEAVAITAALAPFLSITASNGGTTPVTASITPSLTIAAANAETVQLTAAIAPSLTITASNTEVVALTAAIAPALVITTLNTEAVALTGSITSSLVITDTNTEAVALSAGLAPFLTITATITSGSAGALTTAIAPSLTITDINTEAVALTAAVSPTLVVTESDTEAVQLTAALSPGLVVAATNHEAVALTASSTPILTISASIGDQDALTSAIAPSLAITAANQETVQITASIGSSLAVNANVGQATGVAIGAALGITASLTEKVALTAAVSPSLSLSAINSSSSIVQITASLSPSLTVTAATGVTLISAAIGATSSMQGGTYIWDFIGQQSGAQGLVVQPAMNGGTLQGGLTVQPDIE